MPWELGSGCKIDGTLFISTEIMDDGNSTIVCGLICEVTNSELDVDCKTVAGGSGGNIGSSETKFSGAAIANGLMFVVVVIV